MTNLEITKATVNYINLQDETYSKPSARLENVNEIIFNVLMLKSFQEVLDLGLLKEYRNSLQKIIKNEKDCEKFD